VTNLNVRHAAPLASSLWHKKDHWLPGFNFNVEEWASKCDIYETLAICRSLALARAVFDAAVEEKPTARFTIRSHTRVVKRHPEVDW